MFKVRLVGSNRKQWGRGRQQDLNVIDHMEIQV